MAYRRDPSLTLAERIRAARLVLSNADKSASMGLQLHVARVAVAYLRLTKKEERLARKLDPPLRPGD